MNSIKPFRLCWRTASLIIPLLSCAPSSPAERLSAKDIVTNSEPNPLDSVFLSFFEPYQTALTAVGGSSSTSLVQLGLPQPTAIVAWYLLEENSSQPGALTLEIDGVPVPQDRIIHWHNHKYKTGRIEIHGLEPDTRYSLMIHGDGIVTTAPLIAYTRSANSNAGFSFLFGSCFQPYDYRYKPGTRILEMNQASIRNLAARAEMRIRSRGPSFYLGLGDQIYVDPGADKEARIAYIYGKRSEKLRGKAQEADRYLAQLYRFHFAIPGMSEAFRSIPTAFIWDDHDIRDGWGSHQDEGEVQWRTYYEHAREAFVAFQAARNPGFASLPDALKWSQLPSHPEPQARNPSRDESAPFSFDFDWAAGSFYVFDGRNRMPTQSPTDRAKGTNPLIGEKEKREIENWLGEPSKLDQPTVFVFAYPVPVSGNVGKPYLKAKGLSKSHTDDINDRIHNEDRQWLLELFVKHLRSRPHHKLLILSGDVHYSGLQSLHYKGEVIGYEIISSGIAQTRFNKIGSRIGTVSGSVRGIDSQLLRDLTVIDHGVYSGPCFAELSIGPAGEGCGAPEIGLLFYPSLLGPKFKDATELQLDWLEKEKIPLITNSLLYPANEGAFSNRRFTYGSLHNRLRSFWEESSHGEPTDD